MLLPSALTYVTMHATVRDPNGDRGLQQETGKCSLKSGFCFLPRAGEP